jgi:hypothetical protein
MSPVFSPGRLPKDQFPHGICPFQSGHPTPVAAGVLQSQTMQIAPSISPCFGSDCQLWESGVGCSLRAGLVLRELLGNIAAGVVGISESIEGFQPALGCSSPMAQIADCVGRLVEMQGKGGATLSKAAPR